MKSILFKKSEASEIGVKLSEAQMEQVAGGPGGDPIGDVMTIGDGTFQYFNTTYPSGLQALDPQQVD
tara:strand:+ start:21069 stop:21269 length:201 start_codon:yes stop_codon:yes gene_type:complete